jgi:CRISPR-associated protein Csb2
VLAIAWQYLTGRAVATDPNDREQAEWPPHPDRVFQALVAAWGEGDAAEAPRAALDWLSRQGAPSISVPPEACPGSVVKVFVPVNDIEGAKRGEYGDKHLALLPGNRTRKERFFPATNVGSGTCALIWPDAELGPHASALAALCAAVTHIGHSSSLVRMWLCDDPPPATWSPSVGRCDLQLRTIVPGRLAQLGRAYADGGLGWVRPPMAPWQGYAEPVEAHVVQGAFDHRMIVFRKVDGPRLGLAQARSLGRALRGMLIAAADDQPVAKRLFSGHEPDDSRLEGVHIGYVPLPFVGDPDQVGSGHADGHVMGMALAVPRDLDPNVEQELLDVVAAAFAQDDGTRTLTLGTAGVMALQPEDRPRPPMALRSSTWTRASMTWGTVTPIVLDRSPPRRHANHDGWAVEQITQACHRQQLPVPQRIELMPVAPVLGAPPARAFPPVVRKDGTRRWHLHARLHFPRPVRGPLLLGAGRYLGYGLCRPLQIGEQR